MAQTESAAPEADASANSARLPETDEEVAARLGGNVNSGGVFAPADGEGPEGRSLRFKRRADAPNGFRAFDMRIQDSASIKAARNRVNVTFGFPLEELEAANDNQAVPDCDDLDDRSAEIGSMHALDQLTHPGGLVEDLVDWIVSSAERPSRALALSASLAFVAALVGRRFASPTDLRTNLYIAALAPSGVGKDHARAQLKRLIGAGSLHSFSGPSRFMSATGMRNALMNQPSCISMMDEFGGFIRQITDRRASTHQQLIRNDLLELFSCAATYLDGQEYAGQRAERLFSPNLSVYGTSTPEDFWSALTSANSADGLLPRFILFNVDGPKPASVDPATLVTDVPPSLVERCQALAMAGRRGNVDIPTTDRGDRAPIPVTVPIDAGAAVKLSDLKEAIEAQEATCAREALPFMNRAAEHAIKLALVVAVATDPAEPRITGDIMAWAIKLAWLSVCTLVREANERVADNAREANVKRLLGHIKRAGSEGISPGKLIDRNKGISAHERTEILMDLQTSGRVQRRTTVSGGRPKVRYCAR